MDIKKTYYIYNTDFLHDQQIFKNILDILPIDSSKSIDGIVVFYYI